MQTNEDVIRRFYTAFQQLDHKTMNACYNDEIVFSDPVFLLLKGEEVKSMWEMLCTSARDFSLSFSNIQLLDEEYATCFRKGICGCPVTGCIFFIQRLNIGKTQ